LASEYSPYEHYLDFNLYLTADSFQKTKDTIAFGFGGKSNELSICLDIMPSKAKTDEFWKDEWLLPRSIISIISWELKASAGDEDY
jgi:hypothetical protein